MIRGSWQQYKYESLDNGQVSISRDIDTNSVAACIVDNQTVFKSDGSLEFDEGPTKCNPNDPQVYTSGSYAVIAEGDSIRFVAPDTAVTVEVNTLTADTLIYSNHSAPDMNGVINTIRQSYTRP